MNGAINDKFSKTGMYLGIIAVILSSVPYVGVLMGIIGMIVSALGYRDGCSRRKASAGIICSVAAIIVGAVFTLCAIA